jgi:hypothetical protein
MLRLKYRDLAVFVPKLYGVAINELLGALFGVVVAFTEQVYAVLNATVLTDDVRSITVHGRCPVTCCDDINSSGPRPCQYPKSEWDGLSKEIALL